MKLKFIERIQYIVMIQTLIKNRSEVSDLSCHVKQYQFVDSILVQ